MCEVINTFPTSTAVELNIAAEVRAWMMNYVRLFSMDAINFPYPNPDADLANHSK